MVSRSIREHAGLLFLHSHPDPRYPAGFSSTDWSALRQLAAVMPDLLDGPFAAGVVSPHGWTASLLRSRGWETIERITSSGRCLELLEPSEARQPEAIDDRQVLALGRINDRLQRIRVTVIGVGGLGSPLAETLVRMGVAITVVDPDRLDTISNLRRIFGAKREDLEKVPLKAELVVNHCRGLGFETDVQGVALDVRKRDALSHLLESDVMICGTDTHSSRAVLNTVAYAFHLPLIDCGVRPGLLGSGILESLAGEIRIVGPGLACLFCTGSIDPDTIRRENLPEADRERLAREGYGTGTTQAVPSVAALTVGGAGFMASALVGILGDDGAHRASRYYFDTLNGWAGEKEATRSDRCICHHCESQGEEAPLGMA
jgi:hypothetical protein